MQQQHFSAASNKIYTTLGAGIKIVMNENFVVSADWGKSLDNKYGNTGLYVAIGYLF
jgi:hypothetical protein